MKYAMRTDRSLVPSAYQMLRDEILHGDLMPGERLRVSALNKRYQMGLTPLREALVRLASEGLVENEANRGASVRQASVSELRDLFSARREIEAICLRRAMANRTPEWEAEILRAQHLLSRTPVPKSSEDRARAAHWEAMHRQFHRALVAACDSQWRLSFWETLADHSERYRKLRLVTPGPDQADPRNIKAEHEAIAQAVLAGDEDRAVALMDSHLAATEQVVAQILRKTESKEGETA
ncbi:GntR family transcriptional regulator [Paracoccus jeotgali]|uniref:GntR family transcriptional regulator n=2 Tax=Paracoccus jeotgali TaxID=2065379 RepID=A0A2K9MGN1_9RHOB|nr:GntR family transcriptional regulator [Paracoccus jeotgali]